MSTLSASIMDLIFRFQGATSEKYCSLVFAALLIAYFTITVPFEFAIFIPVHKWMAKSLSRIYDILPRKWVWRRLFPNMMEPADSGVTRGIILPNPPPEVANILERMVTFRGGLHVAVTPEAFDLQQRPSSIFTKRLDDDAERRRRIRLADPIVYLERGDVTAVITQFGDFPIERETVENALTHEDGLLD